MDGCPSRTGLKKLVVEKYYGVPGLGPKSGVLINTTKYGFRLADVQEATRYGLVQVSTPPLLKSRTLHLL
jgi:hypothetical protein